MILLEEDAEAGGVFGAAEKGVSRRHYALKLGLANLSFYLTAIREFESTYPGPYRADPTPPVATLTRELGCKLQAMLIEDDFHDRLIRTNTGHISRWHYSRRLNVSPANDELLRIISEFNSSKNFDTLDELRAQEARAWLQHKFDAGELRLWNGLVERKECLSALKLKGGSYVARHSALLRVFEEFDELVTRTGYLPNDQRAEQEKIRSLVSTLPPVRRKGLKVNVLQLSVQTGIRIERFSLPHLRCLVASKQQQYDKVVSEIRTAFSVRGRVFDFGVLKQRYHEAFCSRLAKGFERYYGPGPTIPGSQFRELVLFLHWLADQRNEECELLVEEARTAGRITKGSTFENQLHAYRSTIIGHVGAKSRTKSSVDVSIANLRAGLNVAVDYRAVPSFHLPGLKHTRFLSRSRSTFVEPKKGRTDEEHLSSIKSVFADACRLHSVDLDANDAVRFFSFVDAERGITYDRADVPKSIHVMLEATLSRLRSKCENVIREAILDTERGAQLLNTSTINVSEYLRDYFAPDVHPDFKKTFNGAYFPEAGGRLSSIGVSNVLRVVLELYGGMCPINSRDDQFGQVVSHLIQRAGGRALIQSYLSPSAEAVGAVMALYQCVSGANVAVARTLNADCLEDSSREGYVRITGIKARAKGKPIVSEIPQDSSLVTALKWVMSSSQPLRELASPRDRDRLFVARFQRNAKCLDGQWYAKFFDKLSKEVLSGAESRITPAMIRPSVLLALALSHDGRLQAGITLAQHSAGVSQSYQQKWPTRLVYDAQIRKAQEELEIVVLSSVPEAARAMGVTADEMNSRLLSLTPTGLGTFCRNIRGRSSNGTQQCSTMNCWDKCPHMVVIAEPAGIAALQIWQGSLREVRSVWERDHPERWERVWLPWLCLADVVEEKMQRGSLIAVWEKGLELSRSKIKEPGFRLPRPF